MQAIVHELQLALGFDEAVLGDLKLRREVVEDLAADELLREQLAGAFEVLLRLFHPEFRAFDLGQRAVFLREQIAVVDLHEQVALPHRLPRHDVEFFEFAADLGLDLELESGRHLAAHVDARFDVALLGHGDEVATGGRGGFGLRHLAAENQPAARDEGGQDDDEGGLFHAERQSGKKWAGI